MEQFLCLGPFGTKWSFLWSSSHVLVHLVSICSFLVVVFREWRRISWIRIHVFHHGQEFSSFISFSVSFWVVRCVFPLSGLLRVFLVLLYYYLTIPLFRYAFLVAILSSKNVKSLWRPVVGMWYHIIVCPCFGLTTNIMVVKTRIKTWLVQSYLLVEPNNPYKSS